MTPDGNTALDELYWRQEILQAMYWMRGEGLAAEVDPTGLAAFLAVDPVTIAQHMLRLHDEGYIEARGTAYRMSPLGLEEGGRSFSDEFADYIRPAHAECGKGCWCKDPKHAGEPCPNGR